MESYSSQVMKIEIKLIGHCLTLPRRWYKRIKKPHPIFCFSNEKLKRVLALLGTRIRRTRLGRMHHEMPTCISKSLNTTLVMTTSQNSKSKPWCPCYQTIAPTIYHTRLDTTTAFTIQAVRDIIQFKAPQQSKPIYQNLKSFSMISKFLTE